MQCVHAEGDVQQALSWVADVAEKNLHPGYPFLGSTSAEFSKYPLGNPVVQGLLVQPGMWGLSWFQKFYRVWGEDGRLIGRRVDVQDLTDSLESAVWIHDIDPRFY